MKTTHSIRLIALASLLALSSLAAQTPAPHLIPFQGRLTDQAGVPQSNGQFTITFNLYDNPVGGATLWTERHEKASVINGTVNVFLGSIQSLNGIDFGTTKHLGITVDADANPATADPEMVPRQMIIPAFHALKAGDSTKLAGHDWSSLLGGGSNNPATGTLNPARLQDGSISGIKLSQNAVSTSHIQNNSIALEDLASAVADRLVPVGTVISYGGDGLPPGWLYCDGSAVSSGTYSALYAAIGTSWGSGQLAAPLAATGPVPGTTNFNLPDLRGYFLRGASRHSGGDPDALLRNSPLMGNPDRNGAGSYQGGQIASHSHSYQDGFFAESNAGPPFGFAGNAYSSYDFDNGIFQRTMTTATTGGNETRPKNAAVVYLIKY
jgi:microcystin-dependent protein